MSNYVADNGKHERDGQITVWEYADYYKVFYYTSRLDGRATAELIILKDDLTDEDYNARWFWDD